MPSEMSESIFRICNEVLDEKLTSSEAIEQIKNLREKDNSVASMLLDIMIVLEIELEDEKRKGKFYEFAASIKHEIIPSDILTLELESGEEVHKKALIRHKTRLYFKQTKFNLLREESEGYAKLITELMEVGTNDTSPEALKTKLLCLIGQFNLDPNRVLIIILQCFECLPKHKDYFIALLKDVSPDLEHFLGLIGFQYSFYQAENKRTPFGLYTMTASLIQAGMVDLMKLIGNLKPNAEGIKESHRLRASNAAQRAKKAETIITTEIAAENSRSNRNADRDINDSQNVVGVSFSLVAATQDSEDDKILGDLCEETTLSVNQKLGLVCALLEEGEWASAQHLIDRLPEFYAVQSGSRICLAMASLIDNAIDNFYRQKCSSKMQLPEYSSSKTVRKGQIGQIDSWDDFVNIVIPILWYLGPRIGYSATTTTKLVRLLTVFFEERAKEPSTSSDKVANILMDVIDECLLCSLSIDVNSPNVALSEDLWSLLQLFPYQHRYRLYGRWKTSHSIRHPELNVNRGKVLGRTKYIMKRLSKETVKLMGRQLGKLCHVHPMTVLDYMLSMVQTFDNFIGPVVESLKFLTLLEFDVLCFCLIEQLANPDRVQLKASDGNLSMWLQALGTMIGSICKKYNVDLAGILNYIANQLVNKKGHDLLILREIIQNMSSVESSINATEEQLEALSGGDVLRLEAGGFSNVRNKRASNRLRDALLEGDLAEGLCILIAQQREFIIHHQYNELPLKLIGEMVDQCRDTLVQFGSFLMQNLKYEEYCKRIPSAAVLMEENGVSLDVAMFLTRTFFRHLTLEKYDESKKRRKLLDVDGTKKLDSNQKFLFFKSAMDSVVDELCSELSTVKTLTSSKQVSLVGIKMLVTFWMLTSYDISVPHAAYDRAVENNKRLIVELENNFEMSKTKRSKELERLTSLESKLKEEQRKQTEHVDRVKQWLTLSQEELFQEKGQTSVPFLSTCILKRALFSELDAIFCSKFILSLHAQRTAYFQTVIFYDKTFNDLLPFISGLTENEASSFGRFLDALLIQANKWNLNKEQYDKECFNFPGFHLKVGSKTTQDPLNHDTFKQLTFKWQMRTLKCFIAALKNPKSEYVVIRNSFVILAKMVSSFPIVIDHYSQLEESVLNLNKREKGKRDDLALLASSYAARLKSIQKNMVEKGVYHPKAEKIKKAISKPSCSESTLTPETNERKKTVEITTPQDVRKRLRTDGNKENDETSENKANGTVKPSPQKEEKSREDGEVVDAPPPPKRIKSTSSKDEKEHEKGKDKEHVEKSDEKPAKNKKHEDEHEKKERREERDQKEEKNHRDNRHNSKKEELDRKKEESKDRSKIAPPRRAYSQTDKRNDTSADAKEHPVDGIREDKRKEVKDDADIKKRKETSNGSVNTNSKDDRKEKNKREERKDEKRESEKNKAHVEVKKVETKKEERHQRNEKLDNKDERKEERSREDKKESKKELRVEKKEDKVADRKRITIDRSDKDEPVGKVSRILSSSKNSKNETRISESVRKHRTISPPREVRRTTKDSLSRSATRR